MGHYLLFPVLLLVAVLTVRDDIRAGRIYNTRILLGLGLGVAAYLVLGLLEAGNASTMLCSGPAPSGPLHWSVCVALNLVIGLVMAIVLWVLGVWAAGDAKLFVVYAFLIPPAAYTRSFVPGFPGLTALVNIFGLVFIYLLFDLARTSIPAAWRALTSPERRIELLKAAPGAVLKMIPLILIFMAMFSGLRVIRELSREGLQPILHIGDFTMFLILFFAFRPLSMLMHKTWGIVVFSTLAVAALVYMGWTHGISGLPELLTPSVLAVSLIVFSRGYRGFGTVNKMIKVGELRPGLVLGQESLVILQSREEVEVEDMGEEAPAPDEDEPNTTEKPRRMGLLSPDGLNDEQIRYIRTRYNDDTEVQVATTMPFSPFMALGVLVTWALGGPLTEFARLF